MGIPQDVSSRVPSLAGEPGVLKVARPKTPEQAERKNSQAAQVAHVLFSPYPKKCCDWRPQGNVGLGLWCGESQVISQNFIRLCHHGSANVLCGVKRSVMRSIDVT